MQKPMTPTRDLAPVQQATQRPERPAAGSPPCDVCGGPTYESHCKIICRNCGYMRDCSDL